MVRPTIAIVALWAMPSLATAQLQFEDVTRNATADGPFDETIDETSADVADGALEPPPAPGPGEDGLELWLGAAGFAGTMSRPAESLDGGGIGGAALTAVLDMPGGLRLLDARVTILGAGHDRPAGSTVVVREDLGVGYYAPLDPVSPYVLARISIGMRNRKIDGTAPDGTPRDGSVAFLFEGGFEAGVEVTLWDRFRLHVAYSQNVSTTLTYGVGFGFGARVF